MVEKSEKVMVSRSRHDALHDDPLRCDRSGATMPANMAATAISSCRSHLTLREVRTTKDEVSRPPNGIRYFVLRRSYFVLFFDPATTTASPPIPAISTTANTSPKAHRRSPPSKSTTPTTPISSTWGKRSGCC